MQESRCAWCLSWAKDSVCAECTAEIIPTPDFGAARMLRDGGVDRFALADRVRALPRNQFVALSSKFDAEWSALQVRMEEARSVTKHLELPGHLDPIETHLLAVIPLGEERLRKLSEPAGADLAAIEASSPIHEVQALAAIARVNQGTGDRESLVRTTSALHSGRSLAAEAAITLMRGELSGQLRLDPYDKMGIVGAVETLHTSKTHAGWGAVALAFAFEAGARQYDEEERKKLAAQLEASKAALPAALKSRDPDLQLGAALLTNDEPTLAAIMAGGHPERSSRARRALASLGSGRAWDVLMQGPADQQREVLRNAKRPLGGAWIDALLTALARDDGIHQEGLYALTSERFAEFEHKAKVSAWVERAKLDAVGFLKLLGWATDDATSDARSFVDAVTRALTAAPPEQRKELLSRYGSEIQRWLGTVSLADAAPIVDAWGEAMLEEAIDLHGRMNGYDKPPTDRAWAHVLGALDRDGANLAPVLAQLLKKHSGVSGREVIVGSLWARMKGDDLARRRYAAMAAHAFRYEVKELRNAEPDTSPWSPKQGAIFIRTMGGADLMDLPAIVREAVEAGPLEDPAGLVRAVIAVIEPEIARNTCTMTWALANVASPVVNAFRSEPADPALISAVAALREGWARLGPIAAAPTPVSEEEARVTHLIDQIEVELRLARETEARIEERARDARERAAKKQRREDEARAQRAAEEEAAQRSLDQAQALLASIPKSAGSGVDNEPLVPDCALPTLADYAGFLKAMQAGGDVMALFAAKGITPASWGAIASAWTNVLTTKPHLAMRFAELLQGK